MPSRDKRLPAKCEVGVEWGNSVYLGYEIPPSGCETLPSWGRSLSVRCEVPYLWGKALHPMVPSNLSEHRPASHRDCAFRAIAYGSISEHDDLSALRYTRSSSDFHESRIFVLTKSFMRRSSLLLRSGTQ
jgi:hypothetical protein